MKDVLRKAGYKATPARLRILATLEHSATPQTAEEIAITLNNHPARKSINEATVYRTLTLLHTEGIVQKTDLRKGAACFEISHTHHHHITCTHCGTIEDFESTPVEKALSAVAKNTAHFSRISDHSLELFGTCNSCITK